MVVVSRLRQVRLIDVLGWLTAIRRKPLPAETPAARLFACLDPYRVDKLRPLEVLVRGYRIDSVGFRLRPRISDPRAMVIQGLAAGRPGRGEGTAALRRLCAAADACGTVLILDARPYATGAVAEPMPRAGLDAWYRRFGFVPTGQRGMQRDPAGRAHGAIA